MNRSMRMPAAAALLGLLLSAAGCGDLLTEQPRDTVTSANFYENPSDALTALSGAYERLRYTTSRDYVFMVETPTPQVVAYPPTGNIRSHFDTYTHQVNHGYVASSWRDMFAGINQANAVIDNVPAIGRMDEALKARLVAEAKFIRAMQYFNLVRLFGGVPLFTSETRGLNDLERPRATADEVYNQIVKDLTEAAAVLPVSYPASEFGRATRGAAQALLGKVYLQRGVLGQANPFGEALFWPTAQPGDLRSAERVLREVISGGQYSLVGNYHDLWNESTEQNSETIFAIQNIDMPGQAMTVNYYLAPRTSGWIYAWTGAGVELPFWQSYAPDDKRRDVTWLKEYEDVNGKQRVFSVEEYDRLWATPSLRKYLIERRDLQNNPRDLVLLRHGDVLLMLAEALWRQDPGSAEALRLVNQVRARAGTAPVARLTEETLYWERNWELAAEQHAWYDGQRFWNLFKSHAESHAALNKKLPENRVPKIAFKIQDPKHRLMPIPQGAMDRNRKLTQNPGY